MGKRRENNRDAAECEVFAHIKKIFASLLKMSIIKRQRSGTAGCLLITWLDMLIFSGNLEQGFENVG